MCAQRPATLQIVMNISMLNSFGPTNCNQNMQIVICNLNSIAFIKWNDLITTDFLHSETKLKSIPNIIWPMFQSWLSLFLINTK